MTKDEIINLVETELQLMYPRTSEYDAVSDLLVLLHPLVANESQALTEALRVYISFRLKKEGRTPTDYIPEARILLAIDLAEELGLIDLVPDIEHLLHDIKKELVLFPMHIETIETQLNRFRKKYEI